MTTQTINRSRQRIYDYLIEKGNTSEANAFNMAGLGAWAKRENIDIGEKLSKFVSRFPEVFVLTKKNSHIHARTPTPQDYDYNKGQGSLMSASPYMWDRGDFQSSTYSPQRPDSDEYLLLQATTQQHGGKRKSRSRSRSRTARKSMSRSRRNRNRRTKTARKH